MARKKVYSNVVFRNPRAEEICPVWNNDCKILMVGSITAKDGMLKGFYYASQKNQLWQLLDLSLNLENENSFMFLKNKLKENYDFFAAEKISENEFKNNRKNIRKQFADKLLFHNIAMCDVFRECYFNNNSSMDTDIILNDENYPIKTCRDDLEQILKNSKIKTVIVNSKFVEKQFKKLNLEGDFEIKYAISPSPRRGSIDSKISVWKELFK